MSGAVFVVDAERPSRNLGEALVYFCCAACAGYFDEHRDAVAAARGWTKA